MLVPIYYPGWVMRLYYDLEDGDTITKVRLTHMNNNEFNIDADFKIIGELVNAILIFIGIMSTSMQQSIARHV